MKKKTFIITLSLLISISISAQKEAYNWLFGHGATLTWNELRSFQAVDLYDSNGDPITNGSAPLLTLNDLPSPIKKSNGDLFISPLNTSEGCFSLSNYTGQLLFFSNGISVWDKNGTIMPNGNRTLTGHVSSAQSGIIFPYPDHPNQYITVTLGQYDEDNLSYSIIDMNENGGLGDVIKIDGNFSNRLNGGLGITGETVTAVAHSNKKDYWIVALGRGPKSYLNIWQVTKNGVKANAPSSTYEIEGINTNADIGSPNGYIKFSPDGKHFACFVSWGSGGSLTPGFCVGKFDARTGIISNIKYQVMRDKTNTVSLGRGYGIEFSEDGKYLYACNTTGNRPSIHFQTELHIYEFGKLLSAANDLPNVNMIAPEKRYVNPSGQSNYRFNGLQMGADKRIYIASLDFDTSAKGSLFVIDNPSDMNNVKVYYLPDFTEKPVSFGLPSYSSAWFIINIEGETDFCINTEQEYTLKIDTTDLNLVDLVWDFGDGSTPIVTNISTLKQKHTYTKRGKYTIKVTPRRTGNVEATDLITTLDIKVNNCILPVNHNISNMEYQ